jgi:hypothetical protein
MQNMTSSVNTNTGKYADYKHQTETAVEWKCLFATVNVDLTIASICVTVYSLRSLCTDTFYNITCDQAIPPIATYYHPGGHGFLSSEGNIMFFSNNSRQNRLNYFT